MKITADDRRALRALRIRLRTILPEEYQDSYESLEPAPMKSAGLKYSADGKVAWDEIWGSFCDLAMAGGPPHKGALLEPAGSAEIDQDPDSSARVSAEICRGITMATALHAQSSPHAGWVRVHCDTENMADWLLRAIVMENVLVRQDGKALDLPSSPGFRLEKEIKNVVTVVAKTTHYWEEHMSLAQQRSIASLFASMNAERPLVAPPLALDGAASDWDASGAVSLAETIREEIGLSPSSRRYAGWVGVECRSVRAAIWMMRGLVATNVLARREGTALFVPVNRALDPGGAVVARTTGQIHRLATVAGVP
ncbi:MAG: hypothetical protein AB7F99_00185 [Vicinamibacterales bacterium]